MTYNLNISNVDDNILEVIKSLLKIAPNSSMKVEKNDYSFDDLNDKTKNIISKNLSNKDDGVVLSNYDDIKKFIMDEI